MDIRSLQLVAANEGGAVNDHDGARADESPPRQTHSQLRGGLFLMFALGQQVCGIDITLVRELISADQVTAMPNLPPPAIGVAQRREGHVAVMELVEYLGLTPLSPRAVGETHSPATTESSPLPTVLIIAVNDGGKTAMVGLLVDRMLGVFDVPATRMQPPMPGLAIEERFLQGVVRAGSELRLLLDVKKIVPPEVKQLNAANLRGEKTQ